MSSDRDLKAELARRAARVEAYLAGCLAEEGAPERLGEAMAYSLMAGGKRLRPVLCLAWAGLLGLPEEAAMPLAAGFELIHTYSLIHDDLPAMDDDDLRRGRPSSHKVHGEALAILAGDGLLTRAFGLMASACAPPERVLRAIAAAAWAEGPAGMVGGQVLDIANVGQGRVSLEELQRIHALKTGLPIVAACLSGVILAGGSARDEDRARAYGARTGLAFQIVDDILDVVGDAAVIGKPVGSDQELDKSTYPSLVGLDRSRELAAAAAAEALDAISSYFGPQADFLRELTRYIVVRAR